MKLKRKTILFLEGMLSKEEKIKFKESLKKRPALNTFIEEYRLIDRCLKSYFQLADKETAKGSNLDIEVKKDINEYLIDYKKPHDAKEENYIKLVKKTHSSFFSGKKRPFRFPFNMAATFFFMTLILSSVIFLRYIKQNKSSNKDLFSTYFSPEEDPLLRDINSRYIAFEEMESRAEDPQKTYRMVKTGSILRNNSMNYDDLLLLSIFFIKNKDHELARAYLNDVINHSTNHNREIAFYYISLLHIQLGNYQFASQYLNSLCKSGTYYQGKACEILNRLNNIPD